MGEYGIFLLIGLPRSGKSTWAKKQGFPIVNPDSIRLALHGMRYIALAEPFVWAITYLMVKALHLAGHDWVIVDATNTTQERRKIWWNGYGCVRYVWFKANVQTCMERAKKINDDAIIPIIQKMDVQFEPPTDPFEIAQTNTIEEIEP